MWIGRTIAEVAEELSELASAMQVPTVADALRLATMIDFVHANRSKLGIVLRKLAHEGKTAKDCVPAIFLYADGSLQNRGSKTQGGHLIGAGFLNEHGGAPAVCNPQGWQSAAIKRVCTSTFDGETLSLLRGTEDATYISYLQQELIFGTFMSIAERVLQCAWCTRKAGSDTCLQ